MSSMLDIRLTRKKDWRKIRNTHIHTLLLRVILEQMKVRIYSFKKIKMLKQKYESKDFAEHFLILTTMTAMLQALFLSLVLTMQQFSSSTELENLKQRRCTKGEETNLRNLSLSNFPILSDSYGRKCANIWDSLNRS